MPRAVGSPREVRIAMLSPPWIPVPPPAYGGIEEVVRLLCDGLIAHGHDVTLFAPPGSRSSATVAAVLEEPHPNDIEKAQYEVDHVAGAFAAIDQARADGRPYGVVHDHTGYVALAMADRLDAPLVHTLHGPFDEAACRFYARHGRKACSVAISQAQLDDAPPEMDEGRVVPNPIEIGEWPFEPSKQDYLLWMGRMSPDKGPHRAITAAREAGVPARAGRAGAARPRAVLRRARRAAPRLGRHRVRGRGGGGGEAQALPERARLPHADPLGRAFGLVVVEALACGTPVIAFDEGSAPEVVEHGRTGFVVEDEHAMAAAVERLDEIDPHRCRRSCEERFSVEAVVAGYEAGTGRPRRATRYTPCTSRASRPASAGQAG